MKEYTVFVMKSKHLELDMKVFVMLPKSYHKSDRFYPVLYMHDGQNIFDDKLSYKGVTWGVSEAYDENPELPEVVIVAIETSGDFRTDALVPIEFNFSDVGLPEYGDESVGGKTDEYLSFITKELKPYIDERYRTFKSPKNTALMGSSFGGVCSTYAAIKYTDYFSRFGCVSNAYYVIQDQLEELAKNADMSKVKKLYLDVGTKESSRDIESEQYIESNRRMYEIFKNKMNNDLLKFEIIEDGVHDELAWRARFPEIVQFLFND